ncbi:UDP-glucose 4-epimerase [Nocardioides dokdonensis FR1436]|uniref:UDP-glucose 4-epimerase n=1 Tax=Nocardioides dokdonensis FR1436 TaxID=1300347 RepID=A0A1A9GIX7_9ACTN|nr:polysaccharide biosynthesis protein [Nocardioides dokdonensis]ANH38184.1 UDP-glucose 4-epimerase [Nocardioides dokdonensis FR1436]
MQTDQSTVLVTGGTGSFGSTMVRRLLDSDVREIRVLSRDELKQHEMRTVLSDSRVRFYIGDVRDEDSVHRATRGVDFVFHAAALKQVPSCEFFPMEAVKTNVIGSANVIEAANANGVHSVVCLGTDKAAYPVNAMGISKAMMEKVAQAFARNNPTATTTVSTVRYGNVMMSRGSVIPLFVAQLRAGQPLTLTDPRMTRFLMSLEEAVLLVEYAFENAHPGDLFIRKAPASTIEDLARAVAKALGVAPELKVIGTRHGEKLYETLATREELVRSEDQGDYYRVAVDARDLNYSEYFDEGDEEESSTDDYHSHNTARLDIDQVVELLLGLSAFRALVGDG